MNLCNSSIHAHTLPQYSHMSLAMRFRRGGERLVLAAAGRVEGGESTLLGPDHVCDLT